MSLAFALMLIHWGPEVIEHDHCKLAFAIFTANVAIENRGIQHWLPLLLPCYSTWSDKQRSFIFLVFYRSP